MKGEHGIVRRDLDFLVLNIVLIFLAHATAYFTHEYSHAFTAWALGWMRSPLDIDYGRLTLSNILFQQDVGDGVDYAAIFASGDGRQAALIAFDGPGIGNGVLYVLAFSLLRRASVRSRPLVAMFLFWMAVMDAGNVWSYAPVRTVTTHADMALVARGLHLSTWALLPLVTAPSLLIAWSFFARLLPLARRTLFDRSAVADTFATLMACSFYFVFFGHPGFGGSYGEMSALLSIASMFLVFPLTTMFALFAMPANLEGTGDTCGRNSEAG